MSSWPLKMPVLGWWPIAMKQPLTASSTVQPSFVLFSHTPVTPDSSPSISSSVCHSKSAGDLMLIANTHLTSRLFGR